MSDDGRRDRLTPRNVVLSDEAIGWIVRIGSEAATAEERAAFEEWRNRSPAHANAAAEAAAIMESIGVTGQADEYREIGTTLRHTPPAVALRVSRRAVLAGGAATAATVGLIGSGAFGPPLGFFADYATGVGERERVVLQDGSVAWLNTATALSANFSDRERRLTLHAGGALFEVAKDKTRPFVFV